MATKTNKEVTEEVLKEEAPKKAVKAEAIVPYSAEDKVEIAPLFYDKEKYSAPVPVGYNGKIYLIPRGVSGIKVPRAVAEILAQSEYQNQAAGRYMTQNEGVKNMGEF